MMQHISVSPKGSLILARFRLLFLFGDSCFSGADFRRNGEGEALSPVAQVVGEPTE